MGILLGKSDQTLTNFEVTNQQVSFESFRNVNRAIDKSGQIYQFREKGSFDLEFNYMDNGDYQTLSHLLRNRNSLRDGLIFQPIPYAGDASTILTFANGGATHKTYTFETTTDPLTHGLTGSEFSSGGYDNIKAYDTNYAYYSSHLKYAGFLFRFNLAAFLSAFGYQELRRLTLVTHGMQTSPVRFAIYDQVNGSWYPIVDKYDYNADFTDANFYLYRQLVAQMSTPWAVNTLYDNYCTDGTVWFMMVTGLVSETILLQYIRLFVNGYWVAEDESGNFENYATAFTGAGRSGTCKLIEL